MVSLSHNTPCLLIKKAPSDAFTGISWYKPSELGTCVALIFSAATIAGAFSAYITLGCGNLTDYSKQCQLGGFLAVAIRNMDGIGGRPGWAWIFILEGLFTVLVACASLWVLPDFLGSAKFLSETERMCFNHTYTSQECHSDIYVGVYIIRKLEDDRPFGGEEEKFKLKCLWQCLTDWKTYVSRRSPTLGRTL